MGYSAASPANWAARRRRSSRTSCRPPVAKPWHRHVPRQVVDVQHHVMPALLALDVERPHAVGPHVREVHRLDWIVEAGTGHLASTRNDSSTYRVRDMSSHLKNEPRERASWVLNSPTNHLNPPPSHAGSAEVSCSSYRIYLIGGPPRHKSPLFRDHGVNRGVERIPVAKTRLFCHVGCWHVAVGLTPCRCRALSDFAGRAPFRNCSGRS
jgi:hypothetical protein